MTLLPIDGTEMMSQSVRATSRIGQIAFLDAAGGEGRCGWLRLLWRRAQKILATHRRPARRLRVAETVAFGERRFIAVIEFEQARFLVGGTSGSLALLARLENHGEPRTSPAECESVQKASCGIERDGIERDVVKADGTETDGTEIDRIKRPAQPELTEVRR